MQKYLLLLFLVTLLACKLPENERENLKNQKVELPNQTADTINVIYSEKGIVKLKLQSPKLVMSEKSGEQYNEFPEGVKMEFYNKDGEKNADLTADYGFDNTRKRERYAKGNVIINFKDGTVYTTEELHINETKDSIYNNGKPVRITQPSGTLLQGDTFYSNSRMDLISIKNVHDSTVPIDEEQVNSPSTSPAEK